MSKNNVDRSRTETYTRSRRKFMAYVGEFTGNSALFNCPNNSLIATSYAIKTDQFVGGFKQFDRLLVGVLGFVEAHDGLENFEVESLCTKAFRRGQAVDVPLKGTIDFPGGRGPLDVLPVITRAPYQTVVHQGVIQAAKDADCTADYRAGEV
jgi:hypothetical protein